jgi:hypothetical protein
VDLAGPRAKCASPTDRSRNNGGICPAEDVGGDEDMCSYEEQPNICVAKMKEILKLFEHASRDMYVALTSKIFIRMLLVRQIVVECVTC